VVVLLGVMEGDGPSPQDGPPPAPPQGPVRGGALRWRWVWLRLGDCDVGGLEAKGAQGEVFDLMLRDAMGARSLWEHCTGKRGVRGGSPGRDGMRAVYPPKSTARAAWRGLLLGAMVGAGFIPAHHRPSPRAHRVPYNPTGRTHPVNPIARRT